MPQDKTRVTEPAPLRSPSFLGTPSRMRPDPQHPRPNLRPRGPGHQ